ncbi:MAG TPA: PRTRC system protein B [Terriglobia bacterium]|nr:PRTRC system protein B [Terriglobia bacterium]
MEAQVRIGNSRHFALKSAVLVYGDGPAAFATLHEVQAEKGQTPYLGPGQSLTTSFLRALAHGLGARVAPEILPENILARTPDMVVWWSQAQRRVMFFGGGSEEAQKLNGRMYPHPPLVFKISGQELFVRALGPDARPSATTPLKTAPYWNTDGQGLVCQGNMRVPDDVRVGSIAGWEDAYFSSEFTHASGAARLTSHPGGFFGLWSSLADSAEKFPTQFLTDAKQTLREFIEGDEEG